MKLVCKNTLWGSWFLQNKIYDGNVILKECILRMPYKDFLNEQEEIKKLSLFIMDKEKDINEYRKLKKEIIKKHKNLKIFNKKVTIEFIEIVGENNFKCSFCIESRKKMERKYGDYSFLDFNYYAEDYFIMTNILREEKLKEILDNN